MKFRKPAVEVDAIQWTGINLEELKNRFGAGMVRKADAKDDPDDTVTPPLLELTTDARSGECCYVRVGEWVVGERADDGAWRLTRYTPERFAAEGFKPAYRDRTDHYVPNGLRLDGRPRYVEVSEPRRLEERWALGMLTNAAGLFAAVLHYGMDTPPETRGQIGSWLRQVDPNGEGWSGMARPARLARIELADPDEYNSNAGHWWWADVSQEPFADGQPHWSHFRGHRVQVDVELHTSNGRDVHEWKGHDEIRAGGQWSISLNRQRVDGDYMGGTDVPRVLRRIADKVEKLTSDSGHFGLDLLSSTPFAEQLVGRRIYYDRTPAVITGTVLNQGCIIVKPVGVAAFPRGVYDLDSEPDGTGHDEQDLYDEGEARSHKVRLDDQRIWWWRKRPFSADEPDGRYRPQREKEETMGNLGGTDDAEVPGINPASGNSVGPDLRSKRTTRWEPLSAPGAAQVAPLGIPEPTGLERVDEATVEAAHAVTETEVEDDDGA